MQMTVNMNGQQQQMQQSSDQHRKGTAEILAASNGIPTSVRVQFDPSCTTNMNSNGQQQQVPFPLSGRTITVSVGPDGNVTTDGPMPRNRRRRN